MRVLREKVLKNRSRELSAKNSGENMQKNRLYIFFDPFQKAMSAELKPGLPDGTFSNQKYQFG
jgi:hypothetical protein